MLEDGLELDLSAGVALDRGPEVVLGRLADRQVEQGEVGERGQRVGAAERQPGGAREAQPGPEAGALPVAKRGEHEALSAGR